MRSTTTTTTTHISKPIDGTSMILTILGITLLGLLAWLQS